MGISGGHPGRRVYGGIVGDMGRRVYVGIVGVQG